MANATIDHDEIRKWAESKGGKPAAVDRTHRDGDVGIIRIMFPNNAQSEHQSLVEISWNEFFEQFEESGLALLYDENSLFSKIVGRDTLEKREHGEHASRHHPDSGRHEDEGASGRNAESRSGTQRSAGGGAEHDLKSREYKDADGNVHHHTRGYVKQHAEQHGEQ
jgi:hypothetical protein